MTEPQKFYRYRTDRIIFGVCGGLAKYFQIDATLVRVLFVLLTLGGSLGLILYIILALVTPLEPGGEIPVKTAAQIKNLVADVKKGAESIVTEIHGDLYTTRNIFGLIILVVGLIMLLEQWGHLRIQWFLFSPFLIILVGLFLLARRK